MEDEIYIRDYIRVMRGRWKLILSIVVIAVVVAAAVGFLSPPDYEAKASVLITKTRAEIVFEPKYRTSLSEEDKELKQALVALVRSNSVAAGAVQQLGDTLEPAERNVVRLQNKVSVKTEGDLIQILVKSSEPAKAAEIADAWAQSYVNHVNSLYTGSVPSPAEMRAQADEAKRDYDEKQGAWESFASNSRLDELGRLISDKELLADVKSLRDQVAAGASSPASGVANSLAIVLLQQQAFAPLPAEVQLTLDSLTVLDTGTENQLRDLDALIATLAARSGGEPGESVEVLRQEILQLKGEHEKEGALRMELMSARDVAWETFTTLDNKANELEVASQSQDVIVRLAVSAAVPELAAARPSPTSVGVAVVLGLIIGVFAAFAAENWGSAARKQDGDGPADRADRAGSETEAA